MMDEPDGWMEQATNACAAREFDSWFDAFVRSDAVRRRYSAPQIEQRSYASPHTLAAGRTERAEDFEISLVDYTYADRLSVERWQANPSNPFQPLDIDRQQRADGSVRVQYQPGIFRDDGEGDSLTLLRKTGRPAAYIFAPANGCWHLTQHLR